MKSRKARVLAMVVELAKGRSGMTPLLLAFISIFKSPLLPKPGIPGVMSPSGICVSLVYSEQSGLTQIWSLTSDLGQSNPG